MGVARNFNTSTNKLSTYDTYEKYIQSHGNMHFALPVLWYRVPGTVLECTYLILVDFLLPVLLFQRQSARQWSLESSNVQIFLRTYGTVRWIRIELKKYGESLRKNNSDRQTYVPYYRTKHNNN